MNEKDVSRFWTKVAPPDARGCRLWMASARSDGYGQFCVGGRLTRKVWSSHRFSWVVSRGPIPDGLCVLHRCDVVLCVSVEHLFLGTLKDNTQDMIAKGRVARAFGSANARAKLTDYDIPWIRAYLAMGYTQRAIGRAVGVAAQQIYMIAHGRRWAHVGAGEPK